MLWELYKRGWDVSSTLTAVKQQLMSGTLKKETPVDPLSRAEVPVFEKAMAERWKDFAHAAVSHRWWWWVKFRLTCR